MIRTVTVVLSLLPATVARAELSANALVGEAAQAVATAEGAEPAAALDALPDPTIKAHFIGGAALALEDGHDS